MIHKYYIKNRSKVCAVLTYDDEKDLFAINITERYLFRGYAPKMFLTDELTRKWINKRLTPEYQSGYEKILKKLDININDPDHRMQLFFKTRACKGDDTCWLAFTEDEPWESSPLYLAGYR